MVLFLKIIKLIINIIAFLLIFFALPLGFFANSLALILDWALTDTEIPKEAFYKIFINYFNLVKNRMKTIWNE